MAKNAKAADALESTLIALLAPVVEDAGAHLERVETTRAGKYSTVRAVVDLSDGPGDLDLDTLGEITQAVSDALDEADPVKGQYTLEVSTPGAERPLATPREFRRAVGHDAEVTTADGTVTGTVEDAGEDSFTLVVDGEPRTVAVADVESARMVVVL